MRLFYVLLFGLLFWFAERISLYPIEHKHMEAELQDWPWPLNLLSIFLKEVILTLLFWASFSDRLGQFGICGLWNFIGLRHIDLRSSTSVINFSHCDLLLRKVSHSGYEWQLRCMAWIEIWKICFFLKLVNVVLSCVCVQINAHGLWTLRSSADLEG